MAACRPSQNVGVGAYGVCDAIVDCRPLQTGDTSTGALPSVHLFRVATAKVCLGVGALVGEDSLAKPPVTLIWTASYGCPIQVQLIVCHTISSISS